MMQKINSYAEKYLGLAQKTGLVSTGTLDSLFPESRLVEIERKIASDKANTPLLWDGGEDRQIIEDLSEVLVLYCVQNNKGIMLDWKFSAEDVVSNIKTLLPGLDIESLGEKQVSCGWSEEIRIEGQVYSFAQEKARVYEIIKPINQHLEKKGLAFITPDRSDDNIYFVLIKRDFLSEFEELGFSAV